MTRDQLIAALSDECRTSSTKVEDVLEALFDLVAETLAKGERFHVGEIGTLAVNPRLNRDGKGFRAAVSFQASPRLRETLRLPEPQRKKAEDGICEQCHRRPRKVFRFKVCDACQHKEWRKRSKDPHPDPLPQGVGNKKGTKKRRK